MFSFKKSSSFGKNPEDSDSSWMPVEKNLKDENTHELRMKFARALADCNCQLAQEGIYNVRVGFTDKNENWIIDPFHDYSIFEEPEIDPIEVYGDDFLKSTFYTGELVKSQDISGAGISNIDYVSDHIVRLSPTPDMLENREPVLRIHKMRTEKNSEIIVGDPKTKMNLMEKLCSLDDYSLSLLIDKFRYLRKDVKFEHWYMLGFKDSSHLLNTFIESYNWELSEFFKGAVGLNGYLDKIKRLTDIKKSLEPKKHNSAISESVRSVLGILPDDILDRLVIRMQKIRYNKKFSEDIVSCTTRQFVINCLVEYYSRELNEFFGDRSVKQILSDGI